MNNRSSGKHSLKDVEETRLFKITGIPTVQNWNPSFNFYYAQCVMDKEVHET